MSEEVNKSTKFTIGCTSWVGAFVSIAIVAIRAFQPNAQPIESWSVSSWCWMALPALFPIVCWIAILLVWLVCTIGLALLDSLHRS